MQQRADGRVDTWTGGQADGWFNGWMDGRAGEDESIGAEREQCPH